MANVHLALVRLRLTESRIKRARDIAQSVSSDETNGTMFLATVQDLRKPATILMRIKDFYFEVHAACMVDFEDKYFDILMMVNSLTKVNEAAELLTSQGGRNSHLAVPKISLPSFDGDPKQLSNFTNLFSVFVINHTDISPVKQLAYLRTSLSGEPLVTSVILKF
ncbi:hypothetical protein PR048_020603 [Dryococelus australis]|uniref:Uncharacterized protein n=1 Tax=Dryococelus australis TaxID=614101 RepID=A0ABQ9H6S7_9NEOP|nr:hypothetical protein PR048_020603 [Dryococelus australis]